MLWVKKKNSLNSYLIRTDHITNYMVLNNNKQHSPEQAKSNMVASLEKLAC